MPKPPILDKVTLGKYCNSICINEKSYKGTFLMKKTLGEYHNKKIHPANLCNICEFRKVTVKTFNKKTFVKDCPLLKSCLKDPTWAGFYIPTKKMEDRGVPFPC